MSSDLKFAELNNNNNNNGSMTGTNGDVKAPEASSTPPSVGRRPPRRPKSLIERARWWFSWRHAVQELRDPLLWHDVLVETVLVVFYMCSVVWIAVTCNPSAYTPNTLHFGLYAGFFIYICIEGWCPICGASVNITRTWAVFLTGRMTPIRTLLYLIVEIGGGAAGAMMAVSLTPVQYHSQFTPVLPAPGVTPCMGMAIEAVLTFNLIVVSLVVSTNNLKPQSVMGSLAVGFSVATGIMAAGTLTGALQNPVVALGYALPSQNFTDHWLYWVGPMLGSTVASLFFIALEQLRTKYGPYSQDPKEEPESDSMVEDSEFATMSFKSDGIRRRGTTESKELRQLLAENDETRPRR